MTNESPPEDLPKRVRSASEIQDRIDADKGAGIASALRTHINVDVLRRRDT